jgi:hypothetical protein
MKRQGAWPRPRSMSALLTNLLLRAQSNETTWGHIAHLCRIWPDGAVGPNDLPDHVRSSLVAPEWVLLASKDLDGLAPAVGEIPLAHVWRAAARLGKPIGRLRVVMEPFHLLGGRFSDSSIVHFDLVQLAAIAGSSLGEVWDELSIWPSLSLDLPKLEANKRDSRPPRRIDEMLSPFMTDVGPHAWAELTPADVIEEAAQQQVSCGDILNKLAPLCDYGVILPELDSEIYAFRPTPLFGSTLGELASKQGHPVSKQFAIAALFTEWQADKLLGRNPVDIIARSGTPMELAGAPSDYHLSPRLLQLASLRFDSQAPWISGLDLAHVGVASATWQISIREVLDIARPFKGLGVSVPEISDRLGRIIVCREYLGILMAVAYEREIERREKSEREMDHYVIDPLMLILSSTASTSLQILAENLPFLACAGCEVAEAAAFADHLMSRAGGREVDPAKGNASDQSFR